nr:RDD family protein [uncultured Glaciecola sp.]
MASSDNPKQHSFNLESPVNETDIEKKHESLIEGIDEKIAVPEKDSDQLEVGASIQDAVIPAESVSSGDEESNPPSSQRTAERSAKETREIVTPYAFTVSYELLGQPLATPARRGCAMLIDVFLIAVLSGLSALLFASFVAMTFFKAGDRLKQQKRFNIMRLALRGSAASLLFIIVFAIVSDIGEPDKAVLTEATQKQDNGETMKSLLDLAAALIEISCKDNSECLLQYAEGVAIGAAAMEIPVQDINATTSDLVSQKEWEDEKKSLFMDKFVKTLNEERNAYTEDILEITQATDTSEQKNTVYSLVKWVEGIMSDLGLGLGWAALYFSVFTAWWRGQTIGKKIVGIEVVKLDGNYPSLWESFGRYGGYGAGFATGLLGFLQIYWDPNRQAIQDKISETLVLRLQPNVHKQ